VQTIDDYVENIGADLVVVGSKTLSKGNSCIPVASMTMG
jgi:nucleotide-binding universal stress UspA family protein